MFTRGYLPYLDPFSGHGTMAHGAAALSACKAAPQAAGALAKASTRALAKASRVMSWTMEFLGDLNRESENLVIWTWDSLVIFRKSEKSPEDLGGFDQEMMR